MGNTDNYGPGPASIRHYYTFALVSQIIGFTMIVLTIVCISKHLGGFGWEQPNLKFNFHILCMVVGMIFFYGNAILVYRVLRKERKPKLKIIHASLNGISLVLAAFGFYCVLDFHNKANIPNFYSLHSWLGIITMSLFISQYVSGFMTFLFPGFTDQYRRWLMPYHVAVGISTFVLSIGKELHSLPER